LAIANLLRNQSVYGNVWMKWQVPGGNPLVAIAAASDRSDSRHKETGGCARRASLELE
jgi:hypothetical protein